ncbi:type II toxin-antitoxin system HicA family toxin [Candidatus Parcubacteria bacterium]|nr:type II toxin-antitoxin system HicA family toxin [Candidatus Parcubacteria bacterium]
MSIIPVLRSREIIAALLKAGFRIVRQVGSHVRLRHASDPTRQTSVPTHPGDIPRWLVREILTQARISVREFLKLLRKR